MSQKLIGLMLVFVFVFGLATAVGNPLPTAAAVPDGLTADDWAQIQKQLPPEAIAAWNQQAKLNASDAGEFDYFGGAVAISGDLAIIGAFFDSHGAVNQGGSAYVFTRNEGVWTEQTKLTASDAASFDYFGVSVAISGDTVVVGAYGDNSRHGSAYIFIESGGVWTEQAKLTANDAASGDVFGFAVALSGDTAVIGAPSDDDGGSDSGSAYVFTRSGEMWSQQAKLTASDAASGDQFGYELALSGGTAVIGAYLKGNESGAAYVFTRSGEMWNQQAKLTASDAASGDQFGRSVGISNDTAVVGAWNDGNGTGSAYVFTRSGEMWSEQAKLTASDAATDDAFGVSVAVSGDTAVIGAYGDNSIRGTAYVFTRSAEMWSEQAKLIADDAAVNDYFGYEVAVSGNTALIGVFADDDGSESSGSAYVFGVDEYTLTVDTAGEGSGQVLSDPAGTTFPASSEVTLTAVADFGSTFAGWSGDVVTTTNPLTLTMDSAKAITATFTLNEYALTTDTAGEGSGQVQSDPAGTTFTHGSMVTLTAVAETGSTFTGWSGDVVTSTNPLTLTMDSSQSITATFDLNQYDISLAAEPSAGGTVMGGGNVAHGQMVTVTAVAETGYAFLHWVEGEDVVSTTASYSFTAVGDRTLVAYFTADAQPTIYLPLIVR